MGEGITCWTRIGGPFMGSGWDVLLMTDGSDPRGRRVLPCSLSFIRFPDNGSYGDHTDDAEPFAIGANRD